MCLFDPNNMTWCNAERKNLSMYSIKGPFDMGVGGRVKLSHN